MATYPYSDTTTVTAFVAAELHTSAANILTAGPWQSIIQNALNRGANDIRTAYAKAGFAPAVFEASDQIVQYVLDQAAYWTIVYGGLTSNLKNESFLKAVDHREELKTDVAITIGGVIQVPTPDGSPMGGISSGRSCAYQEASEEYDRRYGRPGGGRRW